MPSKKDEALAKTGASEGEATTIMALQPDNAATLPEIIRENFGGNIRLADLDRIKIPGAAGTQWLVPSMTEADGESRKELIGVIVAWSDKKAWWPVKFGTEGSATPPSCKSEDMVHGIGQPTLAINAKEQALIDAGKAQGQPTRDVGGWLCSTCPHNVFGSALEGGGKACKDMRFIVMLLQDAALPVLIRVPPTSVLALRNYFKRLASGGKRYYHTMTALTLTKEKNESKIEYSTVVPRAVRFLAADEAGAAQSYHKMMQPMLEAENAVEAGLAEKGEATEPVPATPDAGATGQPAPAGAPADGELARKAERPTGDEDDGQKVF